RVAERRSAQSILARSGIELTAKHGQGRDGVAAVGTAAVDPALLALQTVDPAGLATTRFAGRGEQVIVVHGQSHNEDRLSGPPVVAPGCFETSLVDAEMQVAHVGLAARRAGEREKAEIEAAPGDRVVKTEHIATGSIERSGGVDAHGQ